MHVRTELRELLAAALRTTPEFRGRARLALGINAALEPSGDDALATASMRLGHRMRIDLRAPTERLAFYTGDYDTARISSLMRLFRPGWVVLDVGANIGFYAVPFSARLKTLGGRLHCFEPVPANVERLKLNLRINGLEDSATVWRIGLSNRTSSANITLLEDFAAGAETGNAAILAYAGAAKQPCVEIALRTLEDAWARLGERRLDFIKVDIEGHEDLFFDGAISLIRAHRPCIVAEMNEDFFAASGVNLDQRIGSMFRELRYRWMKFDRSGRWRPTETLCGRRADEDVLLVPEERLDAAFASLHSR